MHSLLANVSTPRSRGWGTMVAVVWRRPPWFIVFSRHVLCFVRGLRKIQKMGPVPFYDTRSQGETRKKFRGERGAWPPNSGPRLISTDLKRGRGFLSPKTIWSRKDLSPIHNICGDCGILRRFVAFCSILWHFAVFCGVLRCFAAFSRVLRHLPVFSGVFRRFQARWR